MEKYVPARALSGLLVAAWVAACGPGSETPAPQITAQGFEIVAPQEGTQEAFGDVKLRIEAPAGIDALTIRERSYEADLARSPEQAHYPLFGLAGRVYSRADVTLNFRNYINAKLDGVGRYEFEIAVRDREEGSVETTLVVVVHPRPEAEEPDAAVGSGAPEAAGVPEAAGAAPAAPVERGAFRFERVGAGRVTGADAFGLTWKNLDGLRVVIEMRGSEDAASRLARLERSDYDAIGTRHELARTLAQGELADRLELAAANDAAAGEVFAVVGPGQAYVLRTDASDTSLSELGTTVTLTGEYKR